MQRTHIVPRYYLSGFSDNTGKIWTYRKGTLDRHHNSVGNTAIEKDFYSRNVETYLANHIENPALNSLQKVRNQQLLNAQEKESLARYCIVFNSRVPYHKKRIKHYMPDVVNEILGDGLVNLRPDGRMLNLKYIKQAIILRWMIERDDQIVDEMFDELLKVEVSPNLINALLDMSWHFLCYFDEPIFLTSDSPFFFFPHAGIGNPLSEVTFPISKNVVLWGSNNHELSEGYFDITRKVVDEINRRTVANATRNAYFTNEVDWISGLLNQRAYQLHRIVFNNNSHSLRTWKT